MYRLILCSSNLVSLKIKFNANMKDYVYIVGIKKYLLLFLKYLK